MITDGNDTSSKIDLRQAVDLAIRSEVPIYCLGIGHAERDSFGHREGDFRDTLDVHALRNFSNLTGGRAFILQGAHHRRGVDLIDQAWQQVIAELRQPSPSATIRAIPRALGVYRRIQVKVKSANFRVRARDGYFASPAASTTARP